MTTPTNNLDQMVAWMRTSQQEIMNKLDYLKIGIGVPAFLAQKGTLFIRLDAKENQQGVDERIYINVDGKTNWTNLKAQN